MPYQYYPYPTSGEWAVPALSCPRAIISPHSFSLARTFNHNIITLFIIYLQVASTLGSLLLIYDHWQAALTSNLRSVLELVDKRRPESESQMTSILFANTEAAPVLEFMS